MQLNVVPVSPLNAPGLMTARGWDTLREAGAVAISCVHPAWLAHLREAGVEARDVSAGSAGELVSALANFIDECPGDTLAWLTDADGPTMPNPSQVLRELFDNREGEWDFVFASPVAPGSAVVESVRIMHELRSPGGDPWSATQTHQSLARYLVEETYEVLDELEREDIDRDELVGEFGDLLFQLVFHARLGSEAADPWTLDDVARALNAKMYRRNPHVFSPEREDLTVEEIVQRWDSIKAKEKTRTCLAEGISNNLPALQRAFKIASRAHAAGRTEEILERAEQWGDSRVRRLVALAVEAAGADDDPESSLRRFLVSLNTLR